MSHPITMVLRSSANPQSTEADDMSITYYPLCKEGILNLLNSGNIMSSPSDDIECNASVVFNDPQNESLEIVDDEYSSSTDDTWTPSIDG